MGSTTGKERACLSALERRVPRGKTPTPTKPPIPADPRLLESDLAAWAGPRAFRGGRRDALLGRVEWLRLTPDGSGLDARVRDHRPVPYKVTVRFRGGDLYSECTCPSGATPACKHAVAAVETLRFPLGEPPKPAEPESLKDFDQQWANAERDYLLDLVTRANWNLSAAARLAGVRNRNSLISRLKKHGLSRPTRDSSNDH